MKLGIVAVYLFGEQNEGLLDLHLSQIEKHTQVPHTIYGSVNRLLPKYRQRLEREERVRVCECPATELRDGEEHAYYLDHLTKLAVEDGASHIVTLHLDSFPIRSGWAVELAGRLSNSCVLATIERIDTACLFFHRDFYLKYHPTFRLPVEERASSSFGEYIREWNPVQHTGIGYGYKAYSEGLSWSYLKLSTQDGESRRFGRVYDDLIFHLKGATIVGERPSASTGILSKRGYTRLVDMVYGVVEPAMPVRMKRLLGRSLRTPIEHLVHRPRAGSRRPRLEQARNELLEDPESFLARLRDDELDVTFSLSRRSQPDGTGTSKV